MMVILPGKPASTVVPLITVYPTVSLAIMAESLGLPATSFWVMEMLPGTIEYVTLAESPVPLP